MKRLMCLERSVISPELQGAKRRAITQKKNIFKGFAVCRDLD